MYKSEVVLDSWSAEHVVSCRDAACRTSQRVLELDLYALELDDLDSSGVWSRTRAALRKKTQEEEEGGRGRGEGIGVVDVE